MHWYVSGPTRYGTTHPLIMRLRKRTARIIATWPLLIIWGLAAWIDELRGNRI